MLDRAYYWGMVLFWKAVAFRKMRQQGVRHPVSTTVGMDLPGGSKVFTVPCLWDNYSFILADGARNAVVVDPGDGLRISRLIEENSLRVKGVLLTHLHPDHVMGLRTLRKAYRPEIVVPRGTGMPWPCKQAGEGEKLTFGGLTLRAIWAPGHVKRNVLWYAQEDGVLFSGDTLFSCGYGFVERDLEREMCNSLMKIAALPEGTLVFCGHEYSRRNAAFAAKLEPENRDVSNRQATIEACLADGKPTIPTTVGDEKRTNPFLRFTDEKFRQATQMKGEDAYELFLALRERKNEYNRQG